MPQIKSAIKSLKTSAQRHERNKSVKTELKSINKKLRELARNGEKDKATALLDEAYAKYDKAAKKGIIHKKNAARNKSKLAAVTSKESPEKK